MQLPKNHLHIPESRHQTLVGLCSDIVWLWDNVGVFSSFPLLSWDWLYFTLDWDFREKKLVFFMCLFGVWGVMRYLAKSQRSAAVCKGAFDPELFDERHRQKSSDTGRPTTTPPPRPLTTCGVLSRLKRENVKQQKRIGWGWGRGLQPDWPWHDLRTCSISF